MIDKLYIKRQVILLAKHHKETCENPDCPIQLSCLVTLLLQANIPLTREEMGEFY